MKEATLEIENLKCHGCANSVTKGLLGLESVNEARVELEEGKVWFTYEGESTVEAVIDKLSSLGYPLKGEANDFLKKARSYVSCATGRISSQD